MASCMESWSYQLSSLASNRLFSIAVSSSRYCYAWSTYISTSLSPTSSICCAPIALVSNRSSGPDSVISSNLDSAWWAFLQLPLGHLRNGDNCCSSRTGCFHFREGCVTRTGRQTSGRCTPSLIEHWFPVSSLYLSRRIRHMSLSDNLCSCSTTRASRERWCSKQRHTRTGGRHLFRRPTRGYKGTHLYIDLLVPTSMCPSSCASGLL